MCLLQRKPVLRKTKEAVDDLHSIECKKDGSICYVDQHLWKNGVEILFLCDSSECFQLSVWNEKKILMQNKHEWDEPKKYLLWQRCPTMSLRFKGRPVGRRKTIPTIVQDFPIDRFANFVSLEKLSSAIFLATLVVLLISESEWLEL